MRKAEEEKMKVRVNGLKCPRCGNDEYYEEYEGGNVIYRCSKCHLIVWIGR